MSPFERYRESWQHLSRRKRIQVSVVAAMVAVFGIFYGWRAYKNSRINDILAGRHDAAAACDGDRRTDSWLRWADDVALATPGEHTIVRIAPAGIGSPEEVSVPLYRLRACAHLEAEAFVRTVASESDDHLRKATRKAEDFLSRNLPQYLDSRCDLLGRLVEDFVDWISPWVNAFAAGVEALGDGKDLFDASKRAIIAGIEASSAYSDSQEGRRRGALLAPSLSPPAKLDSTSIGPPEHSEFQQFAGSALDKGTERIVARAATRLDRFALQAGASIIASFATTLAAEALFRKDDEESIKAQFRERADAWRAALLG